MDTLRSRSDEVGTASTMQSRGAVRARSQEPERSQRVTRSRRTSTYTANTTPAQPEPTSTAGRPDGPRGGGGKPLKELPGSRKQICYPYLKNMSADTGMIAIACTFPTSTLATTCDRM